MKKSHLLVFSLLLLLLLGAHAATISVAIPEVMNPSDVCNGWHPDVCPVALADPLLQDHLAWIGEETGGSVSFAVLANTCPVVGAPCNPWSPTLAIWTKAKIAVTTDIRAVIKSPEAVRVQLLQEYGAARADVALKWYPGLEARHPSNGDPVGDAWSDHPYSARQGWRMFHPSPVDGDAFAVGQTFSRGERRWTKWRSVLVPGTGPFGIGGKVADAWQEVTLR